MNHNNESNQILKKLMDQVGIANYKALSQQAKISRSQINLIRQGKITEVKVATLIKLSQVLRVNPNQLLLAFKLAIELEDLEKSSLEVIESWLIFWPTAVYTAQQTPNFPLEKLLPLIKPLEQLLEKWGVETIGEVGTQIEYDPQSHELIAGVAEIGQMVKVRYRGYRHRSKLLYRAKVQGA